MTPTPSRRRSRRAWVLACGLALLASVGPTPALAPSAADRSALVILAGDYALDGSYALGKGYALVGQDVSYALDDTYALGREYALYALDQAYALLDEYALTDQYALDDSYRSFGTYALDSGYALNSGYALGSGYALASQTAGYALDATYALADDAAGNALGDSYAVLDAYALDENYALARDYALSIIAAAGGVVMADLSRQIGVMIVSSKNAVFAETLSGYALVQEVGEDFASKQFPSLAEAIASGKLTVVSAPAVPSATGLDPLDDQPWGMSMIRTRDAQQ